MDTFNNISDNDVTYYIKESELILHLSHNLISIIIIVIVFWNHNQCAICRRWNVRPGAEKSFVGAVDKKRAPPEKIKHLYSAEIFQRRPDSFLISFMASRNITPGPTTAARQTHRNFDHGIRPRLRVGGME